MSATKLPRIAASIVLLRPRVSPKFVTARHGEEDYEVLMMERSDKRGAFRGAMVFPGGVAEDADRSPEWCAMLGLSLMRHRHHLKLTALRELFEETGILLYSPLASLPRETVRAHRERVRKDSGEFLRTCQELSVKPDLDSLKLNQNWVTPAHIPTRFDTFFFMAIASSVTEAEADGLESVRVAWLPPSRWLDLYEKQEVSLLPPQYYQLAILAGSPKLDDVTKLWDSLNEDYVKPWEPRLLGPNDGPGMCYPGDSAYQLESQASPEDMIARHRLYMNPVPKKEGAVAGRGMVSVLGGAVEYELERNVPVAFGQDSWGAKRRGLPVHDVLTSCKL